MGKRDKELTVEAAKQFQILIDTFRTPGNKGRHDRISFQGMVQTSQDLGVTSAEELTKKGGLSAAYLSSVRRQDAPTLPANARNSILALWERKIAAKIGESQPA